MEKTRTRGTLQEIARKAKVSPATVSRVVNQSASVSEELAARVRAAREKLGIDLRRSPRSRLIAFVLSNRPLLHPFHSQVLTAAQAYCEAQLWHDLLPTRVFSERQFEKASLAMAPATARYRSRLHSCRHESPELSQSAGRSKRTVLSVWRYGSGAVESEGT